jgi:hypothetical protein
MFIPCPIIASLIFPFPLIWCFWGEFPYFYFPMSTTVDHFRLGFRFNGFLLASNHLCLEFSISGFLHLYQSCITLSNVHVLYDLEAGMKDLEFSFPAESKWRGVF